MDTPEDFDTWSEDCKSRYREVKAEWDRREKTEEALRTAEADATAKMDVFETLERRQQAEEAELAEQQTWLIGYSARRKALEKRLKRELAQEYNDFAAQTPKPTPRELRAKKLDVEARYKVALRDLKAERDRRKQRRGDLRRSTSSRRDEIELAERASERANDRVEELEDQLEKIESADALSERYWALVRACGPQDPKPGDPPIPITPRAFVPDNGAQYMAEGWFLRDDIETRLYGREDIETLFVGSFDDSIVLEALFAELNVSFEKLDAPREQVLPDATLETVTRRKEDLAIGNLDGQVWHEGCVEFLWVEGTEPRFAKEFHSNPVSRTVSRAAKEVNDIWASCCVRFKFTLKIVKLSDLGALADAAKGVSITTERKVKCAAKEKVEDAALGVIRGLQASQDCVGFLVVDEIDGNAGFAWTTERDGVVSGAKAGVVTIRSGDSWASGTTVAHELGHGLAGIKHVEGEGTERSEHAHGELMWGEGCTGFPTRKPDLAYTKLTEGDCAKMRAATTATTDICTQDDGGV